MDFYYLLLWNAIFFVSLLGASFAIFVSERLNAYTLSTADGKRQKSRITFSKESFYQSENIWMGDFIIA